MLSRRALVGKIAAGAAGAAIAWTANIGKAKAAPRGNRVLEPHHPGHDQGLVDSDSDVAHVSAPLRTASTTTGAPVDQANAPTTISGPPPWDLVRPLTMGSVVAHGWRVAGLTGVADGACVLTLRNARGREHRVHLCRNDGRPQGLVYTDRLDLMVMNGGQGDLPTEEGLAQAVAGLAHVLATNEASRQQQPIVVALQPHAERLRQYGATGGAKLR